MCAGEPIRRRLSGTPTARQGSRERRPWGSAFRPRTFSFRSTHRQTCFLWGPSWAAPKQRQCGACASLCFLAVSEGCRPIARALMSTRMWTRLLPAGAQRGSLPSFLDSPGDRGVVGDSTVQSEQRTPTRRTIASRLHQQANACAPSTPSARGADRSLKCIWTLQEPRPFCATPAQPNSARIALPPPIH